MAGLTLTPLNPTDPQAVSTAAQVNQNFNPNSALWAPVYNQQSNQQGQVLGDATAASPSAGSTPSSSLLNDSRSSVNRNYDALYKQLDAQAGFVESDRSALQNQLSSLYGEQQGDIQSGYQQGVTGLGRNRQQVEQRTTDSKNTLAENLRNLRTTSQRQIGALGAGDSSASNVMLDYALGRVNAQQATQIQKQSNELMSQIDQKQQDLDTARSDQLRKLDSWRTQNLQQIDRDISGRLEQIKQSRLTANREQQGALDNLELQIKQQAYASAQAIASQAGQYQDVIDSHYQDRSSFLGQSAQQIASSLQGLGLNPNAFQGNVYVGAGPFQGSTIDPQAVSMLHQGGYGPVSGRARRDETGGF